MKIGVVVEMNGKTNVIIRKILVSLIGFTVMAFGVAFSIKAALGTSPISSVPYVTGEISGLSVGTTTIIMHCVFILLQIVLLRKDYQIFQLSQLVVALIFGGMTDFAVFCIKSVSVNSYLGQWGLCIIGIILVGIGVSLEVEANFTVVAGEGLVLAITKVFHTKFGNTKIVFDVTLVLIAAVLSFVFLRKIIGVREGTLAAALLVGQISKLCLKHYGRLGKWINEKDI
jgi:uncharacterized membrane protein YczE